MYQFVNVLTYFSHSDRINDRENSNILVACVTGLRPSNKSFMSENSDTDR